MHKHYEYKYCPVCAKRLHTRRSKAHEPENKFCPDCNLAFYQDPKVVACSIVEMDEKIVLIKRNIDPGKGKWVVPGGYVNKGEMVTDAAVRETEEECGLKTRITRLHGVYSYEGEENVMVFYVSQYISGKLLAGDETSKALLCGKNDIPWKNLAFQSTIDGLTDYFSGK